MSHTEPFCCVVRLHAYPLKFAFEPRKKIGVCRNSRG